MGFRAISFVNKDHVEFNFVERAVDTQLKGGKMTKKKVEHMAKVVTSCDTGWGPPGYL